MGLYDRDYSRSEPRGFGGADLFGRSMVTTLIIINVAVFLADQLFGGDKHVIADWLAASGDSLAKPWLWWQLVTAGFAHDPLNIWHLVFNMVGLWMLGRFVEEWLGKWEFLRFYLAAIVIGNIVHSARICLFVDQEWWSYATGLGASGGVTAVIILFVCKFPHVRMLFGIPAWLFGLFVVASNILGHEGIFLNPFADTQQAARVAYDVHLAGAAFAFLYYYFGLNFGHMLPGNWGRLATAAAKPFRARPNLRVHTPREEDPEDQSYRDLDEEGDRLLAKINAEGEKSLTPAERRVLEAYSRRMQQKLR